MSNNQGVEWETYESLAVFLLDKIGAMLGLERVEGKQKLVGDVGTDWEVDGKYPPGYGGSLPSCCLLGPVDGVPAKFSCWHRPSALF